MDCAWVYGDSKLGHLSPQSSFVLNAQSGNFQPMRFEEGDRHKVDYKRNRRINSEAKILPLTTPRQRCRSVQRDGQRSKRRVEYMLSKLLFYSFRSPELSQPI